MVGSPTRQIKLMNLQPVSPIKERAQINKIRNEKEEVNTNTTEIKMIIISVCFVNNYASTNWTIQKKWINVQKHNLLRLNQKAIENLNRPIISNEIETVTKPQKRQVLDQTATQVNSTKYLKSYHLSFSNYYQKLEYRTFQIHCTTSAHP